MDKKKRNISLIESQNFRMKKYGEIKKDSNKGMGSMDSYVIKKPRIDTNESAQCTNQGIDMFVNTDDLLEIKNQDISNCDVNASEEIISRKKCANPFDSSESDDDSQLSTYDDDSEIMSLNTRNILDYFNNSCFEDLTPITGLSETKSQKVIDGRPYKTMKELKANTVINESIIDGCREMLLIKRNLSELLLKCERISEKLTKRINSFICNNELLSTMPNDGIFEQPKSITNGLLLKKYQLVGINWLRIVHEENLNGILADEMGLGKTIQTIAFLSHLYDTGIKGPHIIIVPTSTLNNWERELRVWCPKLKVLVYYGTQDERRHIRSRIPHNDDINVMLTTYNISISSKDDRLFIKKMDFYYGIFDEAHMLKNMMSVRYQYLSNFKIKRKLLLTGTPLQNNLVELISLLSFVMPTMFLSSNEDLKRIFQMSQRGTLKQGQFTDEKIRQVKEMLSPFCLRRLKSQVLSQLPAKTMEVVLLPLTKEQSHLYDTYMENAKNKRIEVKGPISNTAIMELRKMSNHTLLVKNLYTDDILRKMSRDMLLDEDHITSDKQLIFEDFSVMHDFEIHQHCIQYPHAIGKYKLDDDVLLHSNKIQYLDENLPKLIANGDRVLIFSQFVMVLDIIGEFLNYRNFPFLRLDGSTSVDDRQDYIDDFNENGDVHIFLLSTKAGGLGINLTSANVVIIHDIDYNPYNDRQAEDRCHRIGQQRDVRVVKLVSEGTVEQCMLRIATEKLRLEQVACKRDFVEGYEEEEEEGRSASDQDVKEVDFGQLWKDTINMSR